MRYWRGSSNAGGGAVGVASRAARLMDTLAQDVTYALRGLRRSPGLTATILFAFTFGLGVNAALFAAVDRVLFQAPPGVVAPEEVHRLVHFEHGAHGLVYPGDMFSPRDRLALIDAGQGRIAIEGYDTETDQRIGDGDERGTISYATPGFFQLVGVRSFRGRFFTDDENHYGNPTNVAVLNHAYWRRAFGGDPSVLGRTIRIDSTLFTIVGIAQPGFDGLDLDAVDVWAPLASKPPGMEGPWWNGSFEIMSLVARIRHDIDVTQATALLNDRLRREWTNAVANDSTLRLTMAPLLQARGPLGLGRGNERVLALMTRLVGVALGVLVIATSNVASLQLMRALRRRREIAVRVALGVSRGRLIVQLVIETLLLAILGGLGALFIAAWTGGALRRLLLSDVHWTTTVIDARVVGLTVALAILAGVIAGVAPASVALRADIMTALKAGSAETGRPRSPLRIGLLVLQTTLCMVMLAAAGAFIRSLQHAADFALGFDADRLITFQLIRTSEADVRDALARISALPGVASVTRADVDPRNPGELASLYFPTRDSTPTLLSPSFGYADTAYARTIGLQVLSGRWFTAADGPTAPLVAVIDEGMAKQYWRDADPVGQCFSRRSPNNPCVRIVGVAQRIRWDLGATPPLRYYLPATQVPASRSLPTNPNPPCCTMITVRTVTRATPAALPSIRSVLSAYHTSAEFPPTPRLVTERLAPQMRPWRIAGALFLLFGLLALSAASAGIYGLVGYEVTQRTHEFGVRITLGATSRAILALVLGSSARIVAIGVIAGAGAALWSGRVLSALLFETSPYDPAVLAVTAASLSLAAFCASLVPAWRATRVDPAISLRAD